MVLTEIATLEGNTCEKQSRTWFGPCNEANMCKKQCIEWEGAEYGACYEQDTKYMCFCYFNCDAQTPPREESRLLPLDNLIVPTMNLP